MIYDIDFMNTGFVDSSGYYTGGILNVDDGDGDGDDDTLPGKPVLSNEDV